MTSEKIYLDYASTTPMAPQVLAAMTPYFTQIFGNAKSPHSFGQEALKALEDSREALARHLGAQRQEIIFTSGGTESNNLALIGAAHANRRRGNHVIVSTIEHPSVLETAQFLETQGFRVTYLSVDETGTVSLDHLQQAMTDQTVLVSVMHASNEIGTIQPVEQIGRLCRARNIIFHVDAVQTVGHIPVNVRTLSADLLTLSGHKFYGPKGVGALFVRKGVELRPFLLGGDQEHGLRASTHNVAAVVGMAKALDLCAVNMETEMAEQKDLRDFVIREVLKRVDGARLNGHPAQRLVNNCHFVFEEIHGESLLMSLDMAGICASMGSACKAGAMEPSHVLRAIGLPDALALSALRISIGRGTTRSQVEVLLEQLPKIIKQLRV